MATLREIKRRINSVKSTMQITRAMKMVAAAKLNKSQIRLVRTRPYSQKLEQVLSHVASKSKKNRHPLMVRRQPRRACFVVLTGDKGLCGSFNTNLVRRTQQEWNACEAEKKVLVTIGRKGYEFFKKRSYPIAAHYIDIFNNLEFSHALQVANSLMNDFTAGKYDRIVFIYNKFKNAVQQELTVEQLLPIVPAQEDMSVQTAGYVYEPNPQVILDTLVPMSLRFQVWKLLLESATSEFGARMTAMETASENAQEMIKELTLFYNKARQAAITTELNEIVSGAEALKG